MGDTADVALENYRNAWQALRMIREAVETLGAPGVLPSEEAVLMALSPCMKRKRSSTRSR